MGKETKVARRKTKRKINRRTIGIVSFIIIMLGIIILSVYQNRPQRIPADEYFKFSQAIAIEWNVTGNSIQITRISFNITAVGGDAKEVYIQPLQGAVPIEEWPYFPKIIQGNLTEVEVLYRSALTYSLSQKGPYGWPADFRITSIEAGGKVTINVTEY
jgi:hypothetical protein